MKIVLGYSAGVDGVDLIAATARRVDTAAIVEAVKQPDIPDALQDADIFCGHAKVPVDWPRIVERGNLKWIQSSAAGLDHCLVPSVVESPIIVSSCSALFSRQVAETALALLLGLTRRLHRFFPAWQQRQFERLPTDDLFGKRIGILGFGGNGQRIAKLLKPFGVRIFATDCFPDTAPALAEAVFPAEQLGQMLSQIDGLIVTVGLTDHTRHLIGAKELALMPSGSYLVNVGRGEVVDQEALIDALVDGHLTAGLDVAAVEPPPTDSRLWDQDNLLMTPHIGAQSHRRFADVTRLMVANLERWAAGQRLLNQVDKSLGFPLPSDRIGDDWVDV